MAEPIKLELTLDLDRHLSRYVGMDRDGEPIEGQDTLEDIVIREAARQIVDRTLGNGSRDVLGELRRRLAEIRDQEIRVRVGPLLDEALVAALQPTNALGEPRGESVTLRQLVVKTAEEWLRKPAGDSYNSRNALNPVQKMVAEEVGRAMQSELKTALDEAKAEVLAAVREKGAEVLAQTISSMAQSR